MYIMISISIKLAYYNNFKKQYIDSINIKNQ